MEAVCMPRGEGTEHEQPIRRLATIGLADKGDRISLCLTGTSAPQKVASVQHQESSMGRREKKKEGFVWKNDSERRLYYLWAHSSPVKCSTSQP